MTAAEPLNTPEPEGPIEGKCGAWLADNSGRYCRKDPIAGGTRCYKHGGASPQARRAAAENLLRAQALKLIPDPEHRAKITDPIGSLFEAAEEAQAVKDTLAVVVNAVAGPDGKGMGYRGGLFFDDEGRLQGTGTEQTRAEFMAYERAHERYTKLLLDIAKLDLDTRRLRVEEWQRDQLAAMLGVLLPAVLARAGLDYGAPDVRGWVAEEMAALPGVVEG
jgi:hypothetical protein